LPVSAITRTLRKGTEGANICDIINFELHPGKYGYRTSLVFYANFFLLTLKVRKMAQLGAAGAVLPHVKI
jgi:hypothetical protein